MKKLFYLIVFILFYSKAFSQGTQGESWKEVKQKGKGTLYLLYSEFPSFCFKDNDGQYSGIDVELMKDFVKYVKQTHKVDLTVK